MPGMALGDVDAVAATAGPGLIGGVMVGLVTAKALALAAGKPLIAVNHLEAPWAERAAFRRRGISLSCCLLVSGGHCQLLGVEGVGRFRLYGTTIDDAAGEAFDKTAKLLGLALSRRAAHRSAGAGRQSEALRSAPADARARRARTFPSPA